MVAPKPTKKKLKEDDAQLPEIKATKLGRGGYCVTMNNYYTGKGRSLSEALHELANQLNAKNAYESDEFDISDEATRERTKPCKYCGAKIFFAITENMKWMPIDGSTIFAPTLNQFPEEEEKEEDPVLPSTSSMHVSFVDAPVRHRTSAYAILQQAGHPTAHRIKKPQGQVWIAHQDVCGGKKPPEDRGLRERWLKNHMEAKHRNEAIIADLQAMADFDL